MNALEASHEKYPDHIIDCAIRDVITDCNTRVTRGDILSYITDGMPAKKKYSALSKTDKTILSTRITEKMKQYPIENKNHKYTTWLVK
jgi:hypothetical protein